MGVCGVESESRKNKDYKNESPKNSYKHKKNDSKNKKGKNNKIINNDLKKKLDNYINIKKLSQNNKILIKLIFIFKYKKIFLSYIQKNDF